MDKAESAYFLILIMVSLYENIVEIPIIFNFFSVRVNIPVNGNISNFCLRLTYRCLNRHVVIISFELEGNFILKYRTWCTKIKSGDHRTRIR